MKELPGKPFATEDFSLRGGGIDFLGLRWVNLTMVGRDLIPELNNVTTDMGTFFLGGWIPWKFRQLCSSEKDYTERNYKAFREKIEVAMSLALRDDLGIPRTCGAVRNRVGITQKCNLPSTLSFKTASRSDQNTLYAAAIYGPALHALGFIKAYHSQAREGASPLKIPCPGDDPGIVEIMNGVDRSLKACGSYRLLASLDSSEFTLKDVQKLAATGLDPACFRNSAYSSIKTRFRRKLLPGDPTDPGYPRTLTARLVLATLKQRSPLSVQELRDTWYTGMLPGGAILRLEDPELAEHAQRWASFMGRQYQRYAIELFLWCFEDALCHGSRSISDVISHWEQRTRASGLTLDGTFRQVAREQAGQCLQRDDIATSEAWNKIVHAEDDRFEFVQDPTGDQAVLHGLRMAAGWYWRMLVRQKEEITKHLMELGGGDRMSIAWFLQWVGNRADIPLRELLRDIFSSLIFSQHMRIALARFDGTAQRLRFLIGDAGIEPTLSARADLGNLRLPWMPDRLDTLVGLLCDCDVLGEEEGQFCLGSQAGEIS